MTLREALLQSKETGQSFMRMPRKGQTGYGGWVKWDEDHSYHSLTAEDLTADDWVTSAEGVNKLTGGRWQAVEP